MSNRRIDMRNFFGYQNGNPLGSVPQNAFLFGLIMQDRNIKGSAFGLRLNQIPFQYLAEGNIPFLSKTANYEALSIPGRFEALQTYINSNNHEFTLELQYRAEGTEESNNLNPFVRSPTKTKWTIEQISRISAKLESLVLPQYDGSYSPPTSCLLNIGSIFIDFPIIIRTVTVTPKPPFRTTDLMPYNRDITLECISNFPIYQAVGARDLLNQVTERGVRMEGGIERPRRVYAFKKFNRRQP